MTRSLRVAGEAFPLATPFRISRGVKTVADVVLVEIEQDGVVGRGECVPYPRYGETIAGTVAEVQGIAAALVEGADRQDLLGLLPAGAARNAVDCALWDLEAKLSGVTVASRLGLSSPLPPVATAMTVGLDAPAVMGEAAAALADADLVKVKVDRSDPVAQLRAVRAAAPRSRLIVDPNESWSMAEVDGLQGLMAELRVDLLEQPLPADDDAGLVGYVSRIPIAADESVHTAGDLALLPDGYRVVNIKLDKAGGLTAALELAKAARARGLGVMVGCMICTSLSIVPAAIIATGSSFVDLDGPAWLREDRRGGVDLSGGTLRSATPGFWGGR